jgi:YHS domain-containing protein
MMKKAIFSVVGLLAISLTCSVYAEEFKAKCPVSGAAAKKESSVDYKGGKVYFCCDGCPAKFTKDTAKYATKANQQLVVTGQAKQEKCPLTGNKLNPATVTEIGGVKVCFCCDNCKGKVAKASADEQVKMVFGDAAFAKAFKVGSK